MITDKDIYFDSQTKSPVSLTRKCELCDKQITDTGFIFQKYSRSKHIENKVLVTCFNCNTKARQDECLYDHFEGNLFNVVRNIKPVWTKMFFSLPIYRNNKNDLSVFQAADKQLGFEVVIESANLGSREKFDPYLLAKRDEALRLKDEILDSNDFDGFVKSLNVLGSDDKFLEDKR